MIIGLNYFGIEEFAAAVSGYTPEPEVLKYWNEICPADTVWVQMPKTEADISRCEDAS